MRALSYAHRLTHIYSRCRTSCLCRIESLWTSISLPLQMAERFRRAQPDSVANNVKARQSLIERSVTWLATESGWARRKRYAICSGKLCPSFIIFEQCCPCGYAWSLLVTLQRWRSYHSIRQNATRKLHGSMFYRTGVIAYKSFTWRE